MNDNPDLEVWERVTELVQEALPEASVMRCYDELKTFTEVAESTRLLVTVELVTMQQTPITNRSILDSYDFRVLLRKALHSTDSEALKAEMDDCLPLVRRLGNAFMHRSVTRNGLTLKLIDADRLTNSMFDLEDFASREWFTVNFNLHVETTRSKHVE